MIEKVVTIFAIALAFYWIRHYIYIFEEDV